MQACKFNSNPSPHVTRNLTQSIRLSSHKKGLGTGIMVILLDHVSCTDTGNYTAMFNCNSDITIQKTLRPDNCQGVRVNEGHSRQQRESMGDKYKRDVHQSERLNG